VFSFLGNIISIVLSALFKERVLTSVNQLSIVETLHSGQAVMMIISVVLLGPIVEELIFRKSLFSLFKNKKLAIIISSLIFGLIHLIAEPSLASVIINLPAYLIPGLVFGYFYAKNDENILVPTIAHILSNLISVLLIYAI
jgi:membrane protease YdiL (CAAX protease family)